MKKLLYIFLALFVAACNQPEKSGNMVTITGTIENPVNDYLIIMGRKPVGPGVIDSVQVDKDGKYSVGFATIDPACNFSASVPLKEPGFFRLYHGREFAILFLSPGDSLHLTLNTEAFDKSIVFTGRGAAANNYYAKQTLFGQEIDAGKKDAFALNHEQFSNWADSVKNIMEIPLDSLLQSGEPLHDKFKKLARADVLYWWIYARMDYDSKHEKSAPGDTLPADSAYLSLMDFNDADLLELSRYRETLESFLSRKTGEAIKKDTTLNKIDNAFNTVRMKIITEIHASQEVKNYLYCTVMDDQLQWGGIFRVEVLMAEFEKNCTNPDYLAKIRKDLEKWSALAEGKPAPPFAYPDINGDTIALGNFRGKYLYVDVWATWCGPCVGELPHLEKLQEEFKDRNIAFVSISIDNTKDPWEKMVKEKKMKGVQLFAKGWGSDIVKDYKIKGIPRFILIDREGKIINVQAPRPSGNIKELLEKLEGIQT